jgi:DNA-directed RNA polymerase subunit RPC12/RpoP
MRIATRAACGECERTFDLADPVDADEWYAGHDCEPVEEEPDPRTCTHVLAVEWSPFAGPITRCTECGARVIEWAEDE